MKYPVTAGEARLAIIPFVNSCYEDGLHGEGGYPLNPQEELQVYAKAAGKDPERIRDNPLIPLIIQWGNRAYFQGQKDAKEGMV